MSTMMLQRHCREHQITCIWHPEAEGEVLDTPQLGAIRVKVGPHAYQLNTGEIIEI